MYNLQTFCMKKINFQFQAVVNVKKLCVESQTLLSLMQMTDAETQAVPTVACQVIMYLL